MITVYTFGPAFGLPDPSPFVTKGEVLLKLSGLPYQTKRADVRKAPKGKLPYIDDDGTVVADSTFIRFHLEDKHGIDFDKGFPPEQRAVAWPSRSFSRIISTGLASITAGWRKPTLTRDRAVFSIPFPRPFARS